MKYKVGDRIITKHPNFKVRGFFGVRSVRGTIISITDYKCMIHCDIVGLSGLHRDFPISCKSIDIDPVWYREQRLKGLLD